MFSFSLDVISVVHFSFFISYCLARRHGHLEDPRQARVQGVRRYQTFVFGLTIDALNIVHDDLYYYYFTMGLARLSVTVF